MFIFYIYILNKFFKNNACKMYRRKGDGGSFELVYLLKAKKLCNILYTALKVLVYTVIWTKLKGLLYVLIVVLAVQIVHNLAVKN